MTKQETSAAYFLCWACDWPAKDAIAAAQSMDPKTLEETAWLGSQHFKQAWANLERIIGLLPDPDKRYPMIIEAPK